MKKDLILHPMTDLARHYLTHVYPGIVERYNELITYLPLRTVLEGEKILYNVVRMDNIRAIVVEMDKFLEILKQLRPVDRMGVTVNYN